MGMFYSDTNHAWMFVAPPWNVVREDQVGHDDLSGSIYYPRVSSCCSITLHLANGNLVGTHWPIGRSANEFQATLLAMNNFRGNVGISRILFVGALVFWTQAASPMGYHWPLMALSVVTRLGSPNPPPVIEYFNQGANAEFHYRVRLANGAISVHSSPGANAFATGATWTPIAMTQL